MKNVQLLALFGMIATFTGMNASETKFEQCLRLKAQLVEALSRVNSIDQASYMALNNSMYMKAFDSCRAVKDSSHDAIITQYGIFDKELKNDISARDAKKNDCDKFRKELGAALSITTNDTAVKGIIDVYAAELARCN